MAAHILGSRWRRWYHGHDRLHGGLGKDRHGDGERFIRCFYIDIVGTSSFLGFLLAKQSHARLVLSCERVLACEKVPGSVALVVRQRDCCHQTRKIDKEVDKSSTARGVGGGKKMSVGVLFIGRLCGRARLHILFDSYK